ncbi:hypothetical protein DB346_12185 [Verrucomicrobia bacterium LW23]|nr:hypothetical protein DB346_12185 [Verrucomicrobia bacterium LW23]
MKTITTWSSALLLATFALTGCTGDAVKRLEDKVQALTTQAEKAEADKKKAEADLEALKASTKAEITELKDKLESKPVVREAPPISEADLKANFAAAAKKLDEEVKAYFTKEKVAALLAPVPPSTALGFNGAEVATAPEGEIVRLMSDKVRSFPFESIVRVSVQLTNVNLVLDMKVRADSTGTWVFPTMAEVEAAFFPKIPRAEAVAPGSLPVAPGTGSTSSPTTTSDSSPPASAPSVAQPPSSGAANTNAPATTPPTPAPQSKPVESTTSPKTPQPQTPKAPRRGSKEMDVH